jgi:hypothetical protein
MRAALCQYCAGFHSWARRSVAGTSHGIGLALLSAEITVAIGWGALRHRRPAPFVVAMMGLASWAARCSTGGRSHSDAIIGSHVTIGHILNLRHARGDAI